MKIFAAILSLLVFALPGRTANEASKPGFGAFSSAADCFRSYYEERLKLFPLDATFAGDDRYNDLLPNVLNEETRSEQRRFFGKYLRAVEQFKSAKLIEDERMSCDILKWDCEINLRQLEFPTHLLPIDQFNSLHLIIGQLAGGKSAQPFKTIRDYENWLKRLDAFTAWCGSAFANMQLGMTRGYVLPKSLIKKVTPQLTELAKMPVEEHLFFAPIKQMPESFSAAERQHLTLAYSNMLGARLIPAFRALRDFTAGAYLSSGRNSSGIKAIPRGGEYYKLQIQIYTTTELTSEDIFQLGQREVQRLLAEMEKVKATVGFKGDIKSFFEHVRTKKELMPFTNAQQVIDNFNTIHRRMQPSLSRLFHLVPKTGFEVRRTEAFREATASAEYLQGSLDGTRPGIFYVPVPKVAEYNFYADENLFLHEAIPGHHFQISLQQENQGLPQFRRILLYSAYAEGWALYCESLGKELGLYTDPYQYFGMLSAEMHRAIRLVVDTGMHAKGWTREQAIQYSLDHEAEPASSIVAEIERYMAWPGQALSYKVGQLKILQLRERAQRSLGDRFEMREFHDRVLEAGSVPLALLEQKIDRWIDRTMSLHGNVPRAGVNPRSSQSN